MKLLSCLLRTGLLALTIGSSYGAVVTLIGNAYGGSGVRAGFISGGSNSLTYDDVNLTTECISPCSYSYNRPTPGTLNNVSGQTISGVTFVGSNSGAGNALYVRSLTDTNRNQTSGPNYNQLNSSAGSYQTVLWPQWTVGFATAPNVTGTASMNIAVPTGTRSVAFDYGSINSPTTNSYTITVTTASGSTQLPLVNSYQVGANYDLSGPGFYGATSTEDILTVTIIANASTSQWILNIANFRAGVQINAPTPEPDSFLAMGSALILLSFLLRRRGKFARGGAA